MIDWERGYLEEYRQTVAELAYGDSRLTEAQKQELTAHMDAFPPGKKLEFLIGLGADPIAAELASAK